MVHETTLKTMQEKILSALKTKFEGVEDAILNRVASKLAETAKTEEEAKAAAEAVTFQRIIESYGDSRATEAAHTAVTNYEKKFKIKNGKKVQEGGAPVEKDKDVTETTSEEPEMPGWAKKLLDRFEQIETGVKVQKTQNRTKQLSDTIAKLPEALQKPYKRLSVEGLSDEDFQTLISDVQADVTSLESQLSAKGAVFGIPQEKGGNTSDEIPESIKAEIEGKTSDNGQKF